MVRDYIETGVWRLHHEPFHKAWIWTMENKPAFWLLGLFVIALFFVQNRAWSIVRYYLAVWKEPLRLGHPDNPLLHVSQTAAVKETLYHFRLVLPRIWRGFKLRLRTRFFKFTSDADPIDEVVDDGTISWWFGFLALVNGIAFTTIGLLLPLWLTKTHRVQSRLTSSCNIGKASRPAQADNYQEAYSYATSTYKRCWNKTDFSMKDAPGCSDLNFGDLSFSGRRYPYCPFRHDICFTERIFPAFHTRIPISENDLRAIVVTHNDITLRTLGLNSRSPATLNHRLACSPINPERFIWPVSDEKSLLSVCDVLAPNARSCLDDVTYYTILLKTPNGPNKWTNESSGLKIAFSNGTGDLRSSVHTLPSQRESGFNETRLLNPNIRVDNAQVFLVVYEAATMEWSLRPRLDPVFGATTPQNISITESTGSVRTVFHPDFEATAIGCVEKFQYCPNIPGGRKCKPWATWDELKKASDAAFSPELPMSILSELVSVYHYVDYNTLFTNYLQPFGPGVDTTIRDVWDTKLWAEQVVSWYLKNWWATQYSIQQTVAGDKIVEEQLQSNPSTPRYLNSKSLGRYSRVSWCIPLLLEDGDYTNVNLFGFVTALSMMVSIVLFSYGDTIVSVLMGATKFIKIQSMAGIFAHYAIWIRFSRSSLASLAAWYRRPTGFNNTGASSFPMNTFASLRRAATQPAFLSSGTAVSETDSEEFMTQGSGDFRLSIPPQAYVADWSPYSDESINESPYDDDVNPPPMVEP
ncbi:hypothetical protein ABW19_dt0209757 [Dactylella cylindrospora]|nr:hypothetical protein ABW19_dt0209757 [Dactylella cylindrospora]